MTPSPALTGLLADVPFVGLLAHAADRELSGSLELRFGEEVIGTVVLDAGAIVKVAARDPVARLGQLAVGHGLLDPHTLEAALAEHEATGEPLGHRLLARGALKPSMLARLLAEQIALKCAHVALADEPTQYRFHPGVDLLAAAPAGGPRVDVRAAIWRAIEANPPWRHVRAALAQLETAPVQLSAAANLLRFGLDAAEQACAECLRVRPMTLEELRAALIVPPSTATLLVYAFWLTGSVSSPTASQPGGVHAAQLALSTPRLGMTPAVAFAPQPPPVPDVEVQHAAPRRGPPPLPAHAARPSASSRPPLPAPPSSQRASLAPPPPPSQRTSSRPAAPTSSRPAPPASSRPAAPASSRPAPRTSGAVPVARRASSASQRAMTAVDRSFAAAEKALRTRDVDAAIAIAASLTDGADPSPDARALAAFVDAHARPTETGIAASIRALDAIIAETATSARAFHYRGVLRLRIGDEAAAIADLERAVALDPTQATAEDRLRVLALRASGKHRVPSSASRPAAVVPAKVRTPR
ncbi:MAG: hypothetical protein KC657_35400 [Myxococcales bacterium]|nr:hypothetical protein [Myxococcales bacterium]